MLTPTFVLAVLLSAACLHAAPKPPADLRRLTVTPAPQAGQPAAAPFNVMLVPHPADGTCERYSFSFPSPVATSDRDNSIVSGELFRPLHPLASRTAPAVIIYHVIGPANYLLERLQCLRLARHGVTALYFHMPYFGPRGGQKGPHAMLQSPELFTAAMAQATADSRRAVDFLLHFPDVDPRKIGASGVSLGSLMTAVAAGTDPRISRAMMILGGGNLPQIIETPVNETQALRGFLSRLTPDQRQAALNSLRAFDPLTYAPALAKLQKQGKYRLICADRDHVIPPDCSKQLAQKTGTDIIWLRDVNHYTAFVELKAILDNQTHFFAQDVPGTWRKPPVRFAPADELLAVLAHDLARFLGRPLAAPDHAHILNGILTVNLVNNLSLKLPFRYALGHNENFRIEIGPARNPTVSAGQDATSLWCTDTARLAEIDNADLHGYTLFNNPLIGKDDVRLFLTGLAVLEDAPDLMNDFIQRSATTTKDQRRNLQFTLLTQAIPFLPNRLPNSFFVSFDSHNVPKTIDFTVNQLSASIEIHQWAFDTPYPATRFVPPIRTTRVKLPAATAFQTIIQKLFPFLVVNP